MDDLAKLKDKAAKQWAKGSWAAAAEAYEELYKADPKNVMHKLRVGDALVKQGKTAEAIKVYSTVADLYAAEAQLIKAISVCKLILQLDPQQKDTQKRLAALYSKRGVATVASRASAGQPGKPDMGLPDHDGGAMVIETHAGESRVVAGPPGSAETPHSTLRENPPGTDVIGFDLPAFSGAPGPGPSPGPPAPVPGPGHAPASGPGPGPAPTPPISAAPPPPVVAAAPPVPQAAVPPHAPPATAPPLPLPPPPPIPAAPTLAVPAAARPAVATAAATAVSTADPVAPPFDPAWLAEKEDSQSRASEIIELGPNDVVVHQPVDVATAVEQAKAELKEAGNDIDLDALFEDVGDIPQVPPTPLFSDLQPQEFERMIELLSPLRVPEKTPICREGEPANSMFVIAQGSVDVFFTDPAGKRVSLAKLVEGDFFGEFALFEEGVRKASVETLEETELLELSKENFDKVVTEFPGAANVLRMFYYARLADTFLARSGIFGSLTREARWEFVRAMTLQLYPENQPILREGETGDALFMIKSGIVSVWSGSGPEAVLLTDLPAGEIFGEIAVINLQPRTASVFAKTKVEVYRLERESARRLLLQNKELGAKIKEIAEARVRSTIDAMITGSVGNSGQ